MPTVVIIILFVVGWVIFKVFEGVSSIASSATSRQKEKVAFDAERASKYPNRPIDTSKSLLDRNSDIIELFNSKVVADPPEKPYYSRRYGRYTYGESHSEKNYYIDNLTRDCLNEIYLAEGKFSGRPNASYLTAWRNTAPSDWLELSRQIEKSLSARKEELKNIQAERNRLIQEAKMADREKAEKEERLIVGTKNEIKLKRFELESLKRKTLSWRTPKIQKQSGVGNICLDDLTDILKPNEETWSEKEKTLVNFKESYEEYPHFASEKRLDNVDTFNREVDAYNEKLQLLVSEGLAFASTTKKVISGYKKGNKEDIIKRIGYVINDIDLPRSMPKSWDVDFDTEQAIAIIEIGLPDVVHEPVYKKVRLKSGMVEKVLNQKEIKEKVPSIHPAVMLRTAYEVFRNDTANVIKLLVVNGWVKYNDPSTGQIAKTYTSSLMVEKSQIEKMNLTAIEPLTAFLNLKGKSAGKLIEIIPITPTMSLDRKDKRFIATTEVLNKLGSETNLASMDWQDFESLIAELFEKEFAKEGAEVKVTQASRDRGVDAVIFDPDPIRGGKIIVQAKRYANTVDVSAVRDLCAVVKKEGAIKGILVTTSTFGGDAYQFANNEPVTLLNGGELLGLLKKHGYVFRINLEEARKFNLANYNSDK